MNAWFLPFLELLTKSAAVMLAALLLVRVPGFSAAQRSLILLGAFFVLLLLPATTLPAPRWTFYWKTATAPQVPAAMQLASVSPSGPVPGSRVAGKNPRVEWPSACLFVWAAGVAALIGRKFVSLAGLARLKRESRLETDPRILAMASNVRSTLGVTQGIAIRSMASCLVPFTWGVGRCVVMLPEGARLWPDSRLETALRHELCHVARWDWAARWMAHFGAIFFWPNPLVWAGLRAFTASQEQACDDRVVAMGTPVDGYTEELLSCARLLRSGRPPAESLSMARRSTLETRIVALLDESRNISNPGNGAKVVVGILVAGVLALSASAQSEVPGSPGEKPVKERTSYERAKGFIISEITFTDTPMKDVAAILQKKSQEADPAGQGLKVEYFTKKDGKTLSLSVRKIPLTEVLLLIKNLGGLGDVAYVRDTVVLLDPSVMKKDNTAALPEPAALQKAESLMIPKVVFTEMRLSDALARLQEQSKALDPKNEGITIRCALLKDGNKTLNMNLQDLPLSQVIMYVAQLTGMKVSYDANGAVLSPGATP